MAANTEALMAEVRSDLSKYDTAGLIDEDSMYRDIVLAIKGFGADVIKYDQEKVIEVRGGYATLPEGFFSLKLAASCEPLFYKCNNVQVDSLQTSWFYKERIERSSKWNECDASCCDIQEEKVIRENIYFNGGSVDFYYKEPRLLKLGASFKKELCANDCRNKFVRDCPEEIVILDYETVQANFNKGTIYIIYEGLPLDENGKVEIPVTSTGKLEMYLEYYVKRRLAEKLIGNNDDTGLQRLYGIYLQNEKDLKPEARYELKMESLTPSAMQGLRRKNRLDMLRFEMIGNWAW